MRIFAPTLAASAAAAAFLGVAFAQDSSMQGNDMGAAMELPAACQAAEAPAMPDMDLQSMMQGMGEAQQAMMQGMMRTHGPMMQGMMAEDPDVAFACGMIPHHQSAIAMAEAELQHGDAEPMQALARTIIEAQKREIEELTAWLEEQQGAQ